tara:strand:+ start:362 stop:1024 length:663 start_codon:yes stop_codon:yes gene_type:complete
MKLSRRQLRHLIAETLVGFPDKPPFDEKTAQDAMGAKIDKRNPTRGGVFDKFGRALAKELIGQDALTDEEQYALDTVDNRRRRREEGDIESDLLITPEQYAKILHQYFKSQNLPLTEIEASPATSPFENGYNFSLYVQQPGVDEEFNIEVGQYEPEGNVTFNPILIRLDNAHGSEIGVYYINEDTEDQQFTDIERNILDKTPRFATAGKIMQDMYEYTFN